MLGKRHGGLPELVEPGQTLSWFDPKITLNSGCLAPPALVLQLVKRFDAFRSDRFRIGKLFVQEGRFLFW